MAVYLVILVTLLTHTAFKGSKVLMSLYAIELGATPLTIGLLFSVYSIFPVFLSVYAGRLSDRYGYRLPMIFGASGLALGLVLPFVGVGVPVLFLSAGLIGLCYIFYTVSVQHLIGSLSEGVGRTRNYSLWSMGVGCTALLGPTITGFAIDSIGHRATYLMLACLPLVPILGMSFFPRLLPPRRERVERKAEHRVTDLLQHAPLRRILITAGILETGQELFNFYLPIYAHSVGMSASQIGLIMGGYGVALLFVRSITPALVRRSSEERVLSRSIFLAAGACLLFPFVSSFPLLIAVAFMLGLGLGCGGPLSLVLAYNRSPPGRSGEAIGVRQTFNKATEVVMPIIFGTVGTALGIVPVFWGNAFLLAAGGALMRRDAARVKPGAATGT
jgi:MFS family permease